MTHQMIQNTKREHLKNELSSDWISYKRTLYSQNYRVQQKDCNQRKKIVPLNENGQSVLNDLGDKVIELSTIEEQKAKSMKE